MTHCAKLEFGNEREGGSGDFVVRFFVDVESKSASFWVTKDAAPASFNRTDGKHWCRAEGMA